MAHFFVGIDALRLIAVYSPKCASQTVRAWCAAAIEEATGEAVDSVDPFLVGSEAHGRYPDYWKVFFVRDPLRRLVSFYVQWVVRQPARWCFADHQRRMRLDDRSFRQFLFALQHLNRNGIRPQHHLVQQVEKIDDWTFDEVVAVEDLEAGLTALGSRLGLHVAVPRFNLQRYDGKSSEMACDRPPSWLRRNGVPAADRFYDRETRALAEEIYAADISYYREKTGLELLRGPSGAG